MAQQVVAVVHSLGHSHGKREGHKEYIDKFFIFLFEQRIQRLINKPKKDQVFVGSKTPKEESIPSPMFSDWFWFLLSLKFLSLNAFFLFLSLLFLACVRF